MSTAPRRSIPAACVAFALLCLAVACSPDPTIPDPGYEDFIVTGFSLVGEDGRPVDQSILDGHYTVLDFFFTNCPIYCPVMGQVMKRVQDETTGARLLSISVDGAHDTPEIISAYARSLGADPARWRFLTGDPAEVRSLVEKQLKLGIRIDDSRRVSTRNGAEMDFIDHPTRLILVGPDRRVLGMYSYTREDEIDLLIKRLRRIGP